MPLMAGYMVPHPPIAVAEIGCGEEKKIQRTLDSYRAVAEDIRRLAPETLIILSPHALMYADYFHISPGSGAEGNFSRFRAGRVSFRLPYDLALRDHIEWIAQTESFPAGTQGEREPLLDHGTLLPVYFIRKVYPSFKILRISLSGLPLTMHWKFGGIIRQAVLSSGVRAVLIASGDLSHCQKEDGPYGFCPEGPRYDERIMDLMGRGDFKALLDFSEEELDRAMECGHRAFTVLGGAFDGLDFSVQKLSHEATFGVGYGFCMVHPQKML